MLRLLDQNRAVQPPLTNYSKLKIVRTLECDDRVLSFSVPIESADPELKEENYLQTDTAEYVIKSIETSAPYYKISANLNIDELEGTVFETFNTTEQTIKSAIDLALAGTGWTCTCSLTKKRTLKLTNKSTWEIIKQAIKTYKVEMAIDSLHKTITFVEKRGSDKGVYFTSQLNLKTIKVKSDTKDFYTRILPIGKDGLTIESVNNGSKYITNFDYSSKIKTCIWKDERYTDASSLREDAGYKLSDMAIPYKSYSCDVVDLSNAYKDKGNNPYEILSYDLGDTITLMDEYTGTYEKQRVVKITEYPESPADNTCELANKNLTFAEYTQKYDDTSDTVDNITTDNGTVDGDTIDNLDANKLTNLDSVVANTASFQRVDTEFLNVSGQITAVSEKVGDLETTTLKATDADIKYAKIETLKATNEEVETLKANALTANSALIKDMTSDVSKINTLMFGNASGGSLTTEFSNSIVGLIGDAQIKSAMVESLDVAKVNAGDISTNKFRILSDNGNMLIYDNTIMIADDGKKVRVQIGKDSAGDYNMYVWDSAGNLMFDATGLTADGIKRKIIRDDMVSDTADISAEKLNINSLFTAVNNSSNTIKSSKIYIDDKSQTLDVAFKSLDTAVSDMSGTVQSQGTAINAVQGQISSKVWQQDIDATVDNLEVGGRNIITDSKNLVSSKYVFLDYRFTYGGLPLTYKGKALCA